MHLYSTMLYMVSIRRTSKQGGIMKQILDWVLLIGVAFIVGAVGALVIKTLLMQMHSTMNVNRWVW